MALGLYLHVPFCASICNYCNFNRGLHDAALAQRFVEALVAEVESAASDEPVDSIFFGGGTPSLLPEQAFGEIIQACRNAHDVSIDAEITLEVNPETVTAERARAWREAGINRLSLGAQSFDADELRRLDRTHSPERIGQSVNLVRAAGFANISLDLMFWLPGQTLSNWLNSVEQAVALGPDHLSIYLLELYPNAPLKEAMARASALSADADAWRQAPDDTAADMYLEAFTCLDANGFDQYEISNACRGQAESRHNLKYWTGGEWLGHGPGAHSTAAGWRWHNVASTVEYIARVREGRSVADVRRPLAAQERAEEALFTGLRLSQGIARRRFGDTFGYDPWLKHVGRFSELVDEGLMWVTADHFGLTRRGMLVSNEIVALVID